MEPLQNSPVRHESPGSWHPAWRPDTQTPFSSNEAHSVADNSRKVRQDISTTTAEDTHSDEQSSQTSSYLPAPPDSAYAEDANPGLSMYSEQARSHSIIRAQETGLGIDVVPEQELNGGEAKTRTGQKSVAEVVTSNGILGNRVHENDISQSYDFPHQDSDVPLKVDWGNEDRVDPTWGADLEVSHTNVYRQLNHTNSFPNVPPLHGGLGFPELPSLPHSQVEDIMEGITEVEAEEEHADGGYNFGQDVDNQQTYKELIVNGMPLKSLNEVETRTLLTPHDEEARFEEGLPLLASESPSRQSHEALPHTPLEDYFGSKAQTRDTADEDFFANVSAGIHNDAPYSKPPQPDRKTTSQVLSSIQYPPREEVHQNYFAHEESPTFENLTGGGIAVSTSTVASQVLIDHANVVGPDHNDVTAEVAVPKDDDLAALWQAALTDDEFLEEESSVDPSSFFDEDEEGFLNENNATDFPPNHLSPSIPQPVLDVDGRIQGFSNISTAESTQTLSGTPVQSRYTPPLHGQPIFSPLGRMDPSLQSPYSPSGSTNAYGVPAGVTRGLTQQSVYTNQVGLQRPLMPEKSQSFADKSKGGYTSPYDLPMEVSRPRKRAGLQQLQNINNRSATNIPPPPPRSSSIQSSTMSPYGQTVYQNSPTLTSTPTISPSVTNQIPSAADSFLPTSQHKPSTGSFFEELPTTSKARPSSSAGKFNAPVYQNVPPPPTQIPPQRNQVDQAPYQLAQSLTSTSISQPYQLLAPERVLPYATSTMPVGTPQQQQPNINARYSPAPQAQLNLPLTRNRYATPPVAPHRPPSVSQILPHQPRTSSPLARSASVTHQYLPRAQSEDTSSSNELFPTGSRRPSLRTAQTEYPPSSNMLDGHPNNATYASDTNGPTKVPSYTHPLQQSQLMSPDHRAPPPQNLEDRYGGSIIPYSDSHDPNWLQNPRKGSLGHQISPKTLNSQTIQQPSSLNERLGARRSSLAGPNFIIPSDGSEHDPLERWKGCPVFNFGFGGHVVTSFPTRIPRYTSGQLVPMIKCGPGAVHVRSGKIIPLEEHIADFPGPLKSKGKKKDVLLWLGKGIERLGHQQFQIDSSQTQIDPLKRHEERILLWKVLHVLIEYDGVLEGNMNALKAIRDILSPELVNIGANEQQALYESQVHSRAISRSSITEITPESTSLEDVESLRRILIQGEREKAVWHAVDKKLWGHALLLATTLPKELWKQVTQEFIRSEVKPVGDKAESLAALYDVLTGSWEESVDKLVPPSARAGLQMISKTAASGPVKNALDGLDRWRETLSLILSNRSADDGNALLALGRLLANYGRIEAAHICYIFSRSSGLFGGPDDPQASIALLGADHVKQPLDYGRDIDSILLTEIYEYAFAVLAPSSVPTVAPHLQAHKLNHALLLAEYGYRDEAQQYCDAVMNVLKATTKPSPYYHAQLFSSLDDLTNRLRQAPKDGSSSWIPRPSMDKVSGSVWNRLNQFITGDDSDATSIGSGKGVESEPGPFARVAGDTPISRAQSPDFYGSYANGGNHAADTTVMQQPPSNARYAPGGQYTPHTLLDQISQQMPEPQRVGQLESLKRSGVQRQPSYTSLPTLSPDLYTKQPADQHHQSVRPSSATFSPEHERYAPAASSRSSHSPELPNHGLYVSHPQDPYSQEDYQSNDLMSSLNHGPQSSLHSPPNSMSNQLSPYGPRSGPYQPVPSPVSDRHHSAAYEPRSASYEPRSYQPSPVSDKPLPPAPYSPPALYEPQESYEPFTSSYEPPSYEPLSASLEPQSASLDARASHGYEPPSSSYDPPSYDPETQNSDTSPMHEERKGKSYLDDDEDDDLVAKAAALKKAEKAKKDREADEAFRKAAEADAQKDTKGAATKSGWFGWLAPGSKAKDPSSSSAASSSSSSRGPIRARLGEESSFVYDATLKKWVNKKAGAEAPTASAPTPPPPRGPPSRAVSAAGALPPPSKPPPIPMSLGAALSGTLSPGSAPPSQGPSRNASPGIHGAASPTTPGAPGSDALASPPMGTRSPALGEAAVESSEGAGLRPASAAAAGTGPPSAPPSRPTTAVSAASSIDDLIGAPAARKGGTVKGKKKGRGYVDVMAK